MTEAVMQGAATAATEKPTLKDLVRDFITMALIVRRGRQRHLRISVGHFFANGRTSGRSANSVEQIKTPNTPTVQYPR